MDKNALDKLSRARANLILDQPFFGSLALRLRLIEDSTIPTCSVNGKEIRYNPTFINGMESVHVKTVVAHEVAHCVFAHPMRAYGRNPMKWNMAGDYVINLMLKEVGFLEPPCGWLYNTAFANMSADHVYNLLPDVDSDSPGLGKPGGALCQINSSSSGSGNDPAHGQDESTTAEDERDWKIAAVQAASVAKMRGKLPANLERFCEDLFAAKVDWKTVLRRFITARSAGDYTWNRPNRKFLPYGFVLPTLYSEAMGEMVVAVDTSGSIDQPTLDAFNSEISAIAAEARPERVHVIYCDAQVNHVDVFERGDEVKLHPHGGGGTAFAPPFDYVEEHSIEPVCFVYLTDGYGPFPEEPAYPTLWVMTTDVLAPFGENLKIEL